MEGLLPVLAAGVALIIIRSLEALRSSPLGGESDGDSPPASEVRPGEQARPSQHVPSQTVAAVEETQGPSAQARIGTARLIAAALLLTAVLDLPYGFYTLLRLVVTAIAIWSAIVEYRNGRDGWAWIFGFVALGFNPIVPVYLDREIWILIDLGVAVLFFVSLRGLHQSSQ